MRFVKHVNVQKEGFAADILHTETGLSKSLLKDCLNKGAVWLDRTGKKERRIRKAKFKMSVADRLSLYYDERILKQPVPEPRCIFKEKNYSIWNKPSGLLSQGTRFGDHCSLLRFVEKNSTPQTIKFLVHRLDREAQGMVLVAHNTTAAAIFSDYFRNRKIEKRYEAVAEGLLGAVGDVQNIDKTLDGKSAKTIVTVMHQDVLKQQTTLDINLLTGRYHQIRRHLSEIGYPLVGDLRYGKIRESTGLMLKAYKLSFLCPFTKKKQCFDLKHL